MKKVLIAVVVIVIVVIAAGVVLYSNLDSIVKTAIEDVGSKATDTSVTLEDVEISPTSGEGTLRGLAVANPEGYQTDSAIRFGAVTVNAALESLTGDVIRLTEVVVTAPEVTYELGGPAGSNIQAILKNVKEYTGAGKGGAGGQPQPSEGQGKKLIIEQLRIEDGSVRVSAPMLNQDRTVKLPAVTLTDIGKKSNGATAAEVTEQVIAAIAAQAQKAVADLDLGKVLDDARKAIEEGAGGQLEESGKQLEKGLKDLLNK